VQAHPQEEAAVRAVVVALCLLAVAAPASAETAQRGSLRVAFSGRVSPKALPRHGSAPVAVTVGGRISTLDGSRPPQLQGIEIAVTRFGRFDTADLPSCTYEEIQPSTTAGAMAACGRAKVGEGSFSASVVIPEQSPFPSQGKIVAFNGRVPCGSSGAGTCTRPAILAHVYGTEPVPLSYTLVLRMSHGHGIWGTVLSASLPEVTPDVAYVTGLSLTLDRRFTRDGRAHGYVSAGCPAPPGFPGAVFTLARASFTFAGAGTLSSPLPRSCNAKN
jgi:hypothetical protein